MSEKEHIKKSTTAHESVANKILIAPLNWGLGHATRCIPIIHFLIENKYTPIIASDGIALSFLKKEFPKLQTLVLPSYTIRYSKVGFLLKWKLMTSFFSIQKAVRKEQKIIAEFVKKENIVGIISDNRFGVYHQEIPSVYITHQLQVFSGWSTLLSTKIHQNMISKFDACWVPDSKGEKSLSGKLTDANFSKIPLSYLGNLSRLRYEEKEKKYNMLVLLSGPEPQRTIFEKEVLLQLQNDTRKILFVRGIMDAKEVQYSNRNVKLVNYLQTTELQDAINSSELVLCRSGYSTIMDLAKLKKKAFFVPTPGQAEQEYLAKYLKEKGIAPYCSQKKFELIKVSQVEGYTGFVEEYPSSIHEELVALFKIN